MERDREAGPRQLGSFGRSARHLGTPIFISKARRNEGEFLAEITQQLSTVTGYQVRFGADGATVAIVGTAPADVVLITDDATARALHDGTRRAQDAFARGELKVRGRLELLTGRADLFARLADAVAPVRAGTTSGVDR